MPLKFQPLTTDARLRLSLFCLLLGTYLFVYVATPGSADGDALLAVAASTARSGSPNINAIAYADWLLPLPASRMGTFGVDGALYAKKAPTPSLAMTPLIPLIDAAPWLTTRATVMLFNPLVTALTALLLYTLARRLGARPGAAFALGLVYGLATFAIVYVKTLFGEPLAALLLLVAVLQVVEPTRRRRSELIAGVALGALVGINNAYAVFTPLLALYVLLDRSAPPIPRLIRLLLPVAITVALLGGYNELRFGSPLDTGYHFAEGEGFNRPVLTGLYGLFISPYRGVFWYNPVLLLAFPGWWLLRRRLSRPAWLMLGLIAADALIFSAWWSWHGGIVWGPRFLLPVTPLAVALIVPLLDRPDRLTRLCLVGLLTLSLGVQALGALYSVYPYVNGYLNVKYWTGIMDAPVTALKDEVLTTLELSPIVGQMALASSGWKIEPAWAANGVDWPHVAAAAALIAVGALPLVSRRRSAAILALGVAVVSLNVVPARHIDSEIRAVSDTLQPKGTVLAATTLFGSRLIDVEDPRVIVINSPTSPDDPWARDLIDYAMEGSGALWYVTWFSAADALDWPAQTLWQRESFVSERAVPGHRALRFDLTPAPTPDRDGGWRFGSARLDRYGVSVTADGVRLTLQWSTDAQPTSDATWFVHLLDASGQIVAQQDRAPQGGYAPLIRWTPGSPVTDRLFFPLAAGANTGGWTVRIGWVRAGTGERVPVVDAAGQPVADGFIRLPLR